MKNIANNTIIKNSHLLINNHNSLKQFISHMPNNKQSYSKYKYRLNQFLPRKVFLENKSKMAKVTKLQFYQKDMPHYKRRTN